jgi:hypothetical protein
MFVQQQQQQQQQHPSRLVLQLCFAILLLLKASLHQSLANLLKQILPHFDIKKSEKKNCKKRKNHTEATRKQKTQGEEAEQSRASQRCSEREIGSASGLPPHGTHYTRDDDDDPTKPRVVAYVAAENESNHKRFCFLVFSGPPHLFPWGIF